MSLPHHRKSGPVPECTTPGSVQQSSVRSLSPADGPLKKGPAPFPGRRVVNKSTFLDPIRRLSKYLSAARKLWTAVTSAQHCKMSPPPAFALLPYDSNVTQTNFRGVVVAERSENAIISTSLCCEFDY